MTDSNTAPDRKIVIGTRGSALALAQTKIAVEALKNMDPSLVVEIQVIATRGDLDQSPIPMDIVGKGWFTKEIEDRLLDGTIDLAVHSLKDMAQEIHPELSIGAYLPREDVRDVLITKNNQPFAELQTAAVIGTDSSRRQAQMRAMRPDLVMKSLRGNVITRLEKLDSNSAESYDGIILAAAGLKRLGLENRITKYFEPDEMTPAPGQGILALEIKNSNSKLQEMLAKINDNDAELAATVERAFSQKMGGGCKSPIGAYALQENDGCRLIGMVEITNQDGSSVIRDEITSTTDNGAMLGEMLGARFLAKINGRG